MMGSVLCLSTDHDSFYVGYALSGVVEKYSVSTGVLVCSALAHYGDVHTITVVQSDVLCTSGSDGHVRLLDMKSNSSSVETPTSKPAASLPQDELDYRQISNGVISIRLTRPLNDILSQFMVVVCSFDAPQLIDLTGSLSVQSLGTVPDNISQCYVMLTLFLFFLTTCLFIHLFICSIRVKNQSAVQLCPMEAPSSSHQF